MSAKKNLEMLYFYYKHLGLQKHRMRFSVYREMDQCLLTVVSADSSSSSSSGNCKGEI